MNVQAGGEIRMKLNQIALANSLGVVGAAYYVGCYLSASISPDLYKAVAQSWFHMVDLSSAWKSAPEGLILGLISFTIVSWISGFVLAFAYNSFVRK